MREFLVLIAVLLFTLLVVMALKGVGATLSELARGLAHRSGALTGRGLLIVTFSGMLLLVLAAAHADRLLKVLRDLLR